MTRKTGAKAVKARQLARAARVIRYKQKLKNAGESLSLPKPSKEVQKQKDAELRKLYLELVSEKGEQPQETPQQSQESTEQQPARTEQPAEQPETEQAEQQAEQQPEQKQTPEKTEEQAEQGEPDESKTQERAS